MSVNNSTETTTTTSNREKVSLITTMIAGSISSSGRRNSSSNNPRSNPKQTVVYFALVLFLALFVFGLLGVYTKEEEQTTIIISTTTSSSTDATITSATSKSTSAASPVIIPTAATSSTTTETIHTQNNSNDDKEEEENEDPLQYMNQHQRLPRLKQSNNVLSNVSALYYDHFLPAKQALHERLYEEYGKDVAIQMFDLKETPSAATFIVFQSSLGLSRARFLRRLQSKLLQVVRLATTDDSAIPFIWATGGHSASAGHGNYYTQSYTARMESLLRPLFSSVGLGFVGRNYAMGGTSSGLEVGSCMTSIFGSDIDVLSWDYGMTEGLSGGIFEVYFSQAGLHKNRPLMVALNWGGRALKTRQDVLTFLEERGLPVMNLEDALVSKIVERVPESFGITDEEIQAMKPLVRNLKCNKQMEVGDPYCGDERWSPACPERKYKAKWHPGWKYHAMYGTMMALAMAELLEEALKLQIEHSNEDPMQLLSTFKAEEDEEYDKFYGSQAAPAALLLVDDPAIDASLIVRKQSICRTARLPAQTRYLGIMTNSDKVSYTDYDVGMHVDEAKTTPNNPNSEMRLVYEESHGSRNCPFPLNQDFKDYYLITPSDEWQSITVPSDRELEYYGRSLVDSPLKGMIMIAFAACGWKCPAGDLRETAFDSGGIEIQVNNIPVTHQITAWGGTFLKYEEGKNAYFPPNAEGRYEIRARVTDANGYMRLSGISIW